MAALHPHRAWHALHAARRSVAALGLCASTCQLWHAEMLFIRALDIQSGVHVTGAVFTQQCHCR